MNVERQTLTLVVNGEERTVAAPPARRLSELLREDLGLKGTKVGCNAGDCGACTVLVDGAPVCSCLMPARQAAGRRVTTVEGIGGEGGSDGRLADLQAAFLRHGAAQCGICTPGMLMAATSLLRENPHPSRAEVEDAIGGVLCRCTGYQKIVDAVLDAAHPGVAPALPGAGEAVGARIERLDGVPKVAGTEVFGADFWPEGALWVRAVRSPHHDATFSFGDLDAWCRDTPGVEFVFTAADIDGDNRFGVIPAFAEQPALAEGRARFRGEAVALVAGETASLGELDLSGFPVQWQPGDDYVEPEAALAAERPVHDDRPGNVLTSGMVRQGDAEAALSASAHVVDGAMRTAYVEHAYIEPEAGTAWMEGDVLCIQACTQAPIMDRDDTAKVLGLEKEKVRILPAAAGGGFGSKLDLSVQPLIGLVALKTGRPCRMVYARSESLMSSTKRHPATLRARIGADAEGRVTAMTMEGDFNTGAYASWGPTVAGRVPIHAPGPYRTPAYEGRARAVHTHGPVSGAFRGFGVPQAAVLQETLYDELAEACGMDRLEFRRLNALRDGDVTAFGQELQAVGTVECLDALRTRWEEALALANIVNAEQGPVRRGVGVASCWYGCGNTSIPNPSTIRLGVTAEGRLRLHQGAVDIGQGSNTVIPQILADALGVGIDAIECIGADTAITPDCGKTSGSRQTYVSGKAAELAGRALRQTILRLSNRGEGAAIAFDAGRIVITEGAERSEIDLSRLEADANGYVLAAEETYDPPTTGLDQNGQGKPYAVFGYGAQLVELDVDVKLGTVKVRRITAAHDVGRAINPLLAEGQIEGGIAQGLGMALLEEYLPGVTENLHDYLIPTVGDMPEIQSILIEKTDPEGPMGAKGLGEHVLIPTAPAILNAIRHATGAKVTRLPALPHRVLAAIREAEGR
jgi:aldehyde oxidoreductase